MKAVSWAETELMLGLRSMVLGTGIQLVCLCICEFSYPPTGFQTTFLKVGWRVVIHGYIGTLPQQCSIKWKMPFMGKFMAVSQDTCMQPVLFRRIKK